MQSNTNSDNGDIRVALVTGAGRGMGRAIAQALADKNYIVCVADLVQSDVDETLALLGESQRGQAYACNICDSASVTAMLGDIQSHYGTLHALVNNAGIGNAPNDGMQEYQQGLAARQQELTDTGVATTHADQLIYMSDDAWAAVIDVNLNGTFYCCREAVRLMAANATAGAIVNIASTAALSGEGGPHYGASKAAILGLTRSLAAELASRNIRVNAVCPGPTNTEMMQQVSQQWRDAMAQAVPLGRLGEPAEVAKAVSFLCTSDASFITGATLMANGGSYYL